MGLDMYIYKARKLTEEELSVIKGCHVDTIHEKNSNIMLLPVDSLKDEEYMIADLMPYLGKVTCKDSFIDLREVKKDNNVPEESSRSGTSYSASGQEYFFRDSNHNSYNVRLSNEDIQKYVFEREDEYYVVEMQHYHYWRKFYDLQDAIYDYYSNVNGRNIENCGYHKADEGMQEIIAEYDDSFNPDENLFYHEWY